MDRETETTLARLESLVERMDKQIGEMGEAVGLLLWDLHFTLTETPEMLSEVVAVWLSTSFAQNVMEVTKEDCLRVRDQQV